MKKEKTSEVLYRKHRPQSFADVIGEDHVVKVLAQEVKQNHIAHAYLFSGSRGTGKTSVARIFAKELGTSPHDLYEIDAASNTGVDDVRLLNESVHTLPFDSKYKIYILDEAHMLSKAAWNALLKTIEEPPAHVIFILATTELEKVPETIISRCQAFAFKKPTRSVLRDFAQSIAAKENKELEASAAELVALLGDGSFRDTQGILQKIFSASTGKKISRQEVEVLTGAPKGESVRQILEAIVSQKIEPAMSALHAASEANADMQIFARLILEQMRFLFLLRLKAGMENYILGQTSEDDLVFLKSLAAKADARLTSDTLLAFIQAAETSGQVSIPELPLELAIADAIK